MSPTAIQGLGLSGGFQMQIELQDETFDTLQTYLGSSFVNRLWKLNLTKGLINQIQFKRG